MAHIFFPAATGILFQLFMGSGHFCKCLVTVSNFRCFGSMSLSCRTVLNASGWKKDMNSDKKVANINPVFFPATVAGEETCTGCFWSLRAAVFDLPAVITTIWTRNSMPGGKLVQHLKLQVSLFQALLPSNIWEKKPFTSQLKVHLVPIIPLALRLFIHHTPETGGFSLCSLTNNF